MEFQTEGRMEYIGNSEFKVHKGEEEAKAQIREFSEKVYKLATEAGLMNVFCVGFAAFESDAGIMPAASLAFYGPIANLHMILGVVDIMEVELAKLASNAISETN